MTNGITREEFEELGRRLYGRPPNGYGWQTAMARELGMTSQHISGMGTRMKVNKQIFRLMQRVGQLQAENARLMEVLRRVNN